MDLRDDGDNTRFRVNVDGGTIFGGFYDGDGSAEGIPVEGPGTRLMWYPRKAAFRAGYVNGTQWDGSNVSGYTMAVGENVRAGGVSGDHSVAFGSWTVASTIGATAIGDSTVASGAGSVALGYRAHTNARSGSFVFGDGVYFDDGNPVTDDYIRAGVNHSASWRLMNSFRIFTSSNLSTGVTIQSGASVSNWGQSGAVISTSTGALLTTGGVWQNASDVARKHLFEPVSGEDILGRLRTLPIQRWSYRAEDASIRHLGPTSQDFRAAFGLGSDEKSIGTVDADGVALAAHQALDVRAREQKAQIDALRSANGALRGRVETLRARLDAFEAARAQRTAGLSALALFGVVGVAGFLARRRSLAQAR